MLKLTQDKGKSRLKWSFEFDGRVHHVMADYSGKSADYADYLVYCYKSFVNKNNRYDKLNYEIMIKNCLNVSQDCESEMISHYVNAVTSYGSVLFYGDHIINYWDKIAKGSIRDVRSEEYFNSVVDILIRDISAERLGVMVQAILRSWFVFYFTPFHNEDWIVARTLLKDYISVLGFGVPLDDMRTAAINCYEDSCGFIDISPYFECIFRLIKEDVKQACGIYGEMANCKFVDVNIPISGNNLNVCFLYDKEKTHKLSKEVNMGCTISDGVVKAESHYNCLLQGILENKFDSVMSHVRNVTTYFTSVDLYRILDAWRSLSDCEEFEVNAAKCEYEDAVLTITELMNLRDYFSDDVAWGVFLYYCFEGLSILPGWNGILSRIVCKTACGLNDVNLSKEVYRLLNAYEREIDRVCKTDGSVNITGFVEFMLPVINNSVISRDKASMCDVE